MQKNKCSFCKQQSSIMHKEAEKFRNWYPDHVSFQSKCIQNFLDPLFPYQVKQFTKSKFSQYWGTWKSKTWLFLFFLLWFTGWWVHGTSWISSEDFAETDRRKGIRVPLTSTVLAKATEWACSDDQGRHKRKQWNWIIEKAINNITAEEAAYWRWIFYFWILF